MKITSTCERKFISDCIIKRQKRFDGRQLTDGRKLDIIFGKERGCCMVLQGNTRVLAQVSCDITEPKASTPSEGTLHLNLEVSSMGTPDAKAQSRSSDDAIEAQRSLERCIRDSKCIDLEALCIITGCKVWTIRVDIHTLNDDGNLIECASIAALSSLAHFRRPDVTVVGNDVTVHSVEEREPVALNIHHMPLCINLALYDQGKYILVDPIEIEERIADGCYIIGMNAHQELCYVHRHGVLFLNEDSVQRCEDISVKRAQEVTQIIRAALDDDSYKRVTNAPIGFTNLIQTGIILGAKCQIPDINLGDAVKGTEESSKCIDVGVLSEEEETVNTQNNNRQSSYKVPRSKAKEKALQILEQGAEAAIFEGGPNKWGIEEDDDEDQSSSSDISDVKPNMSVKEEINLDSEEETVYITEEQLDLKPESTRRWYSKDPFV